MKTIERMRELQKRAEEVGRTGTMSDWVGVHIELRNILPALLAVVEAADWMMKVKCQRDADERDNAAAGQTYGVDVLNEAEAHLHAALRALEGGAG